MVSACWRLERDAYLRFIARIRLFSPSFFLCEIDLRAKPSRESIFVVFVKYIFLHIFGSVPIYAYISSSRFVLRNEGRETEGFESPHIDAQSIRLIGQARIYTRNPFFAGRTKLRIYIYTQETRNK